MAVVGITLGTIIGVLPGLGGANGVAILLPLTFTMPPTSAIILLTSLYWGALFGGAITSVLFNIPGEPWSVATTFDGYPLARQGQGGQALTAAFTSSFVGAFFSIVLITFFAPLLAEIALKFGPPEFFAIQLLTFSSFVGLGGGNPLKSLVSILIGFILAAAGLDIVTGQLRMTFGFTELMKGFDFIVAVIGLFGIGEILLTVEEGLSFRGANARMNLRVVLDTWKVLPRYWRTFVRGSFIGFWMGVKPGGATPASFMSYAFGHRLLRRPQQHDRYLVHADLRRGGLRFQEAGLSPGPAGAGPRARRPRRERAAPEPDHVPGHDDDLPDPADLGRDHGRRALLLHLARHHAVVAAGARRAHGHAGAAGDVRRRHGAVPRPRILAAPARHQLPEPAPVGRQRPRDRAGRAPAPQAAADAGPDLGRPGRGGPAAGVRGRRQLAAARTLRAVRRRRAAGVDRGEARAAPGGGPRGGPPRR